MSRTLGRIWDSSGRIVTPACPPTTGTSTARGSSPLPGNERSRSHDVEVRDAHQSARVVASLSAKHFGRDGNGAVDWVRDDVEDGARARVCRGGDEISDDARVDGEEIVAGHSGFAGNARGDDDEVGAGEGGGKLGRAMESADDGVGVDVGEIRRDARDVRHVVQVERAHEGGLLEEERERLTDTAGGAEDGDREARLRSGGRVRDERVVGRRARGDVVGQHAHAARGGSFRGVHVGDLFTQQGGEGRYSVGIRWESGGGGATRRGRATRGARCPAKACTRSNPGRRGRECTVARVGPGLRKPTTTARCTTLKKTCARFSRRRARGGCVVDARRAAPRTPRTRPLPTLAEVPTSCSVPAPPCPTVRPCALSHSPSRSPALLPPSLRSER